MWILFGSRGTRIPALAANAVNQWFLAFNVPSFSISPPPPGGCLNRLTQVAWVVAAGLTTSLNPDSPTTCSPPPWPAEPYPRVALIPSGSSATYQDSPYRRSMLSSFASAGGTPASSIATAALASGHGAAAAPGAGNSRDLLNVKLVTLSCGTVVITTVPQLNVTNFTLSRSRLLPAPGAAAAPWPDANAAVAIEDAGVPPALAKLDSMERR